VAARYSRRETLYSGGAATAMAVFGGAMLTGCESTPTFPDDPLPTVGATSSGATTSGHIVTLTGTATDNGTIAAHSWVQTAGPTVTLSGANPAVATFMAPSVAAPTTLTFQYSAADNRSQTATATVSVTVSPAVLGFAAVAKNKLDVVTVPAG